MVAEDDEHDNALPTKSQAKREMRELREIASALGQLSTEQISNLSASPPFRDGLFKLKQLADGEPRKRQIHYLGRRLLEEDEQALRRELASLQSGTAEHSRRLHMAERWRDRLIAEDREAITAFIEAFPETEARHLRNLVHNARKDQAEDKNTGQARKLFRYIKEQIDAGETPET